MSMKKDTKVRVASKKGVYWDPRNWFGLSWYGLGIMLRTASIYTHTELVFPNGESFSAAEGRMPDGSAVGMKKIKYSHPERWSFVDIDVRHPDLQHNFKNVQELYDFAKKLHGNYDWKGVAFHEGIPLGIQKDNEWWCTEAVGFVVGLKKFRINPGQMNTRALRLRELPESSNAASHAA